MAASTKSVGKAALLLKDLGEKTSKLLRKKTIKKGTLLILTFEEAQFTSDGKPAHNYRVYKEESTTLYCTVEDVATLTDCEFQLLLGISTPGARYNVFINETLNWGSKLKVDDTVQCYIGAPTKQLFAETSVKTVANIKWIGTLPKKEGVHFGVEIMEEKYCGLGTTNGCFRRQQLFVCNDNCGMFVSLENLVLLAPNIKPAKQSRAAIYEVSKPIPVKRKMSKQDSLQTLAGQQIATRPQRIKMGDRVVCYNKKQTPINGTVRWTGEAETESGIVKAVGIETDVPVRRSSFFITGKSLHFDCVDPRHGKIVLPEEMVKTEIEVAIRQKRDINYAVRHLKHEEKDSGIQTAPRARRHDYETIRSPAFKFGHHRSRSEVELSLKNTLVESSTPTLQATFYNMQNLVVGSCVQSGNPPRYGVIRWMGNIPQVDGLVAGVELDEPMDGCTDGTWQEQRYFTCQYGQGLFCPLRTLLPDPRYTRTVSSILNPSPPVIGELKSTLQEIDSEKQTLKLKLTTIENELTNKSNELEVKKRELAAAKKLNEEFEKRATDAEIEKDALSAKVSLLENALQSKTKELKIHNTEAWKIPANKLTTHRKIGSGGWGEVMEGTVRVAIKTLHEEITFPKHIEKMEREMKLLAGVRHPNLVQFVGAVFDDQNQGNQRTPPRIVTELLDMNLRQAYERNELAPGNRLSIFKDVARALDYLHQRYEPIIHRDVSAPNILLQEMPNHQWKGKVSDLGSANFLQHAQTAGEGAVVYSAPEVYPRGFSKPLPQTVKIDVYSYGILLCEVTTSQFPSARNRSKMIEIVEKDHPAVYELINFCVEDDPSDRPSMAEVLMELNKMTPF